MANNFSCGLCSPLANAGGIACGAGHWKGKYSFAASIPPKKSRGFEQSPGVAVWLKSKDGECQQMQVFPGPRTHLVHPAEVFHSETIRKLSHARVTDMQLVNSQPIKIREVWKASCNQRSFPS